MRRFQTTLPYDAQVSPHALRLGSSYGAPNCSWNRIEPMAPVMYVLAVTASVQMRSAARRYSGLPVRPAEIGERNVQVRGAHGVSDGVGLLDDGLVILRVRAVDRVLALARVVVLAALVEKELREVAIASVAGLAIQAEQPDLQTFVARDVRLLARSVRGDHRVSGLDGRVERLALAGALEVRDRAFEKRALRANGRVRCSRPRASIARRNAIDQLVDALLERGVGPLGQHVRRGLDELRRRAAAAARFRSVEDMLNRDWSGSPRCVGDQNASVIRTREAGTGTAIALGDC